MTLIACVVIPLIAAAACWVPSIRRFAWPVTMAATWLLVGLSVIVADRVVHTGRVIGLAGWFEADGLSALVLLMVALVCGLACLFAGGYMRHSHGSSGRLWWFYCNYNLLLFALVVVPALAEPNLVWVGVELVTLFGALLVSFDRTAGALEAAWKFSVLTMMGAPIALFGFFLLFWAYRSAGGGWETWQRLQAAAPVMQPRVLALGFLLVFVGFGAKVGLAPMHTWLPDAHSQAPSPVCAVLSGVKTTVPLYAILRLLSVVLASPTARLGQWMTVIGLVSVGMAAALLLQVRDYKRLFAYSTIEHMGIVLVAAGMATRASDFGAVFQLLNHALTKSLCFYVAGLVLLELGTRDISSVRGLLRRSPFAGVALLVCALAIAGAPPFPVFLSELAIFQAGIGGRRYLVVGILAALIVLAFVGIMRHVNRMVFGSASEAGRVDVLPLTCRAAVLAGAVPVVMLGVYMPAPIRTLLTLAARQLGGV